MFVVVKMSFFGLDSEIPSILKSMRQFDKMVFSSLKWYCREFNFIWKTEKSLFLLKFSVAKSLRIKHWLELYSELIAVTKFFLIDLGVFETCINLNFFTVSYIGNLSIVDTWERQVFFSPWFSEPMGFVSCRFVHLFYCI